jgi:hypothetical protein
MSNVMNLNNALRNYQDGNMMEESNLRAKTAQNAAAQERGELDAQKAAAELGALYAMNANTNTTPFYYDQYGNRVAQPQATQIAQEGAFAAQFGQPYQPYQPPTPQAFAQFGQAQYGYNPALINPQAAGLQASAYQPADLSRAFAIGN